MHVVDEIALPSTCFEVISQLGHRATKHQSNTIKADLMMSGLRGYSITGTGDHHFGGLKDGVVGGGEAAVWGEILERGILQIARDQFAQAIQLVFRRAVFLYVFVRQQCRPACPYHLKQTPWSREVPHRRNDLSCELVRETRAG